MGPIFGINCMEREDRKSVTVKPYERFVWRRRTTTIHLVDGEPIEVGLQDVHFNSSLLQLVPTYLPTKCRSSMRAFESDLTDWCFCCCTFFCATFLLLLFVRFQWEINRLATSVNKFFFVAKENWKMKILRNQKKIPQNQHVPKAPIT